MYTSINVSHKNSNKKNCYLIYVRKSSESEDRQMESIPAQVSILKKLAKEKRLNVIRIFKESMSAKKPGRPYFNEMITLIDSQDQTIGVICWKPNRLFRNPEDEGKIRQRLSDGRINEIVTPNKTYYEPDSDFIMAVEGAQAQRFIRDLREDTKRGIDRKLEKGQAPIFAPVGYKNNIYKRQGDKDISPNMVYFPLVRKLFDFALTGNYSLVGLVQKARELGIKNNRGKYISKSQMSRVMNNPFYAGRFEYSGKTYIGVHKPMITHEEFVLLREILSGRSRPRKVKHDFLTGLIRCGMCDSMITAESHTKKYKNGKSQVFEYYCCASKGRKDCRQPYLNAKKLEAQAIEFLQHIKISDKFIEWSVKWLNDANKDNSESRKSKLILLQKEYGQIRKKQESLLDLKISPENAQDKLLSDSEFQEKRYILLQEKERIKALIEREDKNADEWIILTAKTFDFASSAQKRFENGSIEDKKIILRVIGSNLVLKDRNLTIEARRPFTMIKEALGGKDDKPLAFEPDKYRDYMAQSDVIGHQFYLWGG